MQNISQDLSTQAGVDRRAFLAAGAAAGLMYAFSLPLTARGAKKLAALSDHWTALNGAVGMVMHGV